MLERRMIIREGSFVWFMDKCLDFKRTPYSDSEASPWKYRCGSIVKKDENNPNTTCYNCKHNPLDKKA